jgi:16S rRNA (adenine1518-N6/adenine1519-N6)-dimethyltransferase
MSDVRVQTKKDILAILQSAGLEPDRRLGQHFLIDGNLMRKLVAAGEIGLGDTVLEVGGGTGGLTDLLAAVTRRLVVVEIDHDLAPMLSRRFAEKPHVRIVHGDVLDTKHTLNPEVLKALDHNPPAGGAYLLIANLPYNAATPLLMNLLLHHPEFARMCFTIQKEVAARLTANAGSKDFGPLAIITQLLARVERVAKLPASAFWPAPKVESSMIRIDRRESPLPAADLERFNALIHAAFAHRRKTLRYNLGRHLSDEALAVAAEIIDLNDRAEAVELARWIELSKRLTGRLAKPPAS